MKTESNFINYGIYIDHQRSFIIALDRVMHEQFAAEETVENDTAYAKSNNEEHIQNHKNEQLRKFCKAIIEKLENVHSITVFGPSTAKFELQKEIRETKHLKNITEELLVTDQMKEGEALRFVKDHFTPITVDEEIFIVPKKNQ